MTSCFIWGSGSATGGVRSCWAFFSVRSLCAFIWINPYKCQIHQNINVFDHRSTLMHTNISPAVACGEPFYMLFLFLQLLLDLNPSVKDRTVEILTNNLITKEPLAVVALGGHLALLFFQMLKFVLFLKVYFHFLILAAFAYHWFRLSLASLASFCLHQESSQGAFFIYLRSVS